MTTIIPKNYLNIGYSLVFLLHLYGVYTQERGLIYASKPLICILLLYLLLQQYKKPLNKTSKFFAFGLLFSLFGDVFLMLPETEAYFILGLLSFFSAHIAYILSYRSQIVTQHKILEKACYAGLILLIAGSLYSYLYPFLGDLKIAVAAYVIIIGFMVFYALKRCKNVPKNSYILGVLGAVSFLISDSILAVNKFVFAIPNAGIYIMVTYMLAQYLMTQAIIRSQNKV